MRASKSPYKMRVSIVLLILILPFMFDASDDIRRLPLNTQPTEVNSGKALFLTPYIESNRIEEAQKLAYVEPLLGTVRSYSGFITVNKTYNSNMFFWYFPAEKSADIAPVALWLQGGPGTSSFLGVFHGIGPYEIINNDLIKHRDYHWNEAVNVLFIDNPIGSGYSFTESEHGYTDTETDIAYNLYAVLTQFYKLFPELSTRNLYLAGESYGCKYASALAYEIHRQNADAKSSPKINLKGISIGDGYCDPVNMLDYADYLYQIGLIDANGHDRFNCKRDEIIALIRKGNYAEASRQRDALIGGGTVSLFHNLTGFDYNLNMLETKKQVLSMVKNLARNSVMREIVHVGNVTFNDESNVMARLAADRTMSVAPIIQFLIELYPIRFYNGQFDTLDGYTLTVNFLKNLTWSGSEQYKTAGRKIWRVDDEIAGYVKTVKNMSEVLVRMAGHLVTDDQPRWSYNLIVQNFMLAQPLNLTSIE